MSFYYCIFGVELFFIMDGVSGFCFRVLRLYHTHDCMGIFEVDKQRDRPRITCFHIFPFGPPSFASLKWDGYLHGWL
jgi:hypothetical protein